MDCEIGMNELVKRVYHWLFPHWTNHLKRELTDCETLLDLGCGKNSPVQHVSVPYSLGIELYMVRISRVHGPWQAPDEFVPGFVGSLLNGTEYRHSGEAMDVARWTHVHDICAALRMFINNNFVQVIYLTGSSHSFILISISL